MYVRQVLSDARAREKPCIRCGLSLRKHLDDRHCPQCGLSVWMTLNGNDSLDYSSPVWLRRSARGTWAMAAIQVVALLAYLLCFGEMARSTMDDLAMEDRMMQAATQPATEPADATASPWRRYDRYDREQTEPASAFLVLGTAVAGIYFVLEAGGLVLMTVHEQRYPDRARTTRLVARIMAGVAVGVGLILIATAVREWTGGRAINEAISWLELLMVEVTFAACAAASWFWLRPVARRGGKSSMAKLCGYLLFLPVLPFLKAAPFLGLWMFYLVSPLLYLLPLAYIPLSIFLFARIAVLMQQAAPHAEQAWASESATEIPPRVSAPLPAT